MFWYSFSVLLIIVFYFIFVKPFNYWKHRGVPQYNVLTVLRELIFGFIQYRPLSESIKRVYDDFSDSRYCGVYQFYKPLLLIRDPDLIKQIAVKDFDHFVDHLQFLPDNLEPIWEKNLFALKGDKWKDMRATLSPSFTSSKMKIMFTLTNEYAKGFLKYLEEHLTELKLIEMKDIFTRFTNDIIATTAFGYNCDSVRDPEDSFYLMGKAITSSFKGFWANIKFLLIFIFPQFSKKFGLKLFPKKTTDFFIKLIKQNIETREKNGIIRPDMIHLLMEARKGKTNFDKMDDTRLETEFTVIEGTRDKDEEKRKIDQLTDIDITAQALIFFFAGFDSVSALMCFMAHELAVNVDIQERLQAEIDYTLHECNGEITYDILSQMKYMDMVIAETMRKWPAGVAADRVCSKSFTIEPVKCGEPSLTLHRGDLVWIPIYGIHRDSIIYPNSDRFDPERFNEENKSKLSAYQYLPFGVGPRSCIGNRFALMETKLVFLYILSKFNFTVTEKTTVPLEVAKNQFQLTAKDGFWLGLKLRNTV